jgi:DNA repair and recombination protein RAD52
LDSLSPPQNNQQQQQPYQNANRNPNYQTPQNIQSFDQYEYQSLFNLGLNIIEQNGFLIVTGDDIFSKKDSIKACGFRFDSKSKTWYKAIEQGAA